MMKKLILAALLALIAAPMAALWQAGPSGFGAPRFDLGFGGARQVSIGSLVSTGLL